MTPNRPLPLKRESEPAGWSGFTRSLDFPFPLEQIRKDGYDVEIHEDIRGIYWEITKVINKTPLAVSRRTT